MDNPRGRVSRPLPFPGIHLSPGFPTGSSKIRLPLVCAVTVSLVCSGVLCLSMLAGSLVRPFLSPTVARLICFLLLVCMGTLRILDQAIKSFLCRHDGFSRNFMFRALHFQFFLSLRLRRSLQGGCRRLQKPFRPGIRLPRPRDVLRRCCSRLRCSPRESKSCRRSFLFPPIRIYSNTRRLPAWKPPCTKNSFFC